MPGGKGNIKPSDGRQFSESYQPERKWTKKKADQLAIDLIEWMKEEENNIFFEEFIVIKRDLYPGVTSYLCKKFTSFFKLIEKAKKIQELKLYKFGVEDRLNAQITKFVLINEHNKLSENSKVESKFVDDFSVMEEDEIDKEIEKLNNRGKD